MSAGRLAGYFYRPLRLLADKTVGRGSGCPLGRMACGPCIETEDAHVRPGALCFRQKRDRVSSEDRSPRSRPTGYPGSSGGTRGKASPHQMREDGAWLPGPVEAIGSAGCVRNDEIEAGGIGERPEIALASIAIIGRPSIPMKCA